MDSSIRLTSGEMRKPEEVSDEEKDIQASNLVRMAIGLKKVGCDELTALEWVQIIKIALAHAKPHFKYIPFFMPIQGRKIMRFHLGKRYHQSSQSVEGCWLEGQFNFEDNSQIQKIFCFKVVEIGEFAHDTEKEISTKILMDNKGAFFEVICRREDRENSKRFFSIPQFLSFTKLNVLIPLAGRYPQFGPLVIMVISYMLQHTYRDKMKVLESLHFAADCVASMHHGIDFCNGHLTFVLPWGVVDGTDNIVKKVIY